MTRRRRRRWIKKRQYELRRTRRLSKKPQRRKLYKPRKKSTEEIEPWRRYHIEAPKDFRLLKNTIECVEFFKKFRSMECAIDLPSGQKFQRIDLSSVEHIDFASTMVLGAMIDEMLEVQPICLCSGRLPKRKECREYIKDSGFLNSKVNDKGEPYGESSGSDSLRIERGKTRLEADKVRKIVDLEKHAALVLINREKVKYRHIDVIKEICGNAFGWSNAINRQWTLGAKYENDKVIFVVLDLGIGILDSLHRDYYDIFKDKWQNKNDQEILEGAFLRKYKSASEDKNRNRGLPSIKKAFEEGHIRDLCVLTNNVYLDFSSPNNSSIITDNRKQAFIGTLYSWRLDANSFL